MMRRGWLSILFLFLLFGGSSAENNGSVSVDVVYTNASGRVFVGNTGTNNQLQVINGGWLDSTTGIIGNKVSASNNFALVEGANSGWYNSRTLYVGKDGAFNILRVRQGGTVYSNVGIIGNKVLASNNFAVVEGANSVWDNLHALYVGKNGSFNTLRVRQGGTVYSATGVLGNVINSTGNAVLLQDANSAWMIENNLLVGNKGGKNRLEILDGAEVSNTRGIIGQSATSKGNEVLVSGVGSSWENWTQLYVGLYGSENSLVVSNGAAVLAATIYAGNKKNANENRVIVDGAGSILFAANDFRLGLNGSSNQLMIVNGGRVENEKGVVGSKNKSHHNRVVVSGAGSRWENRSQLYVGYYGSENSLVVSNRASVSAATIFVGNKNNAHENRIVVDGAGTRLVATNSVIVGNHGSTNRMVVSNGAAVQSKDVFIGRYADSSNNLILLSDATWHAGEISIGRMGGSNTVSLSDGAVVESENTYLGYRSIGNALDLDGGGTSWSNAFDFVIGANDVATNNFMTIRNGAKLKTRSLAVRSGNGLKLNHSAQVLVTGGTTRSLKGGGQIVIGDTQGNNLISLTQGGEVWSGEVILGVQSGADNNVASISGSGSRWKATQVVIGASGSGNQLLVSDGGTLNAESLVIGQYASSANNRVSVTGAGSSIQVLDYLVVGLGDGENNALSVSDGGRVTSKTTAIHNQATLRLEEGQIGADYIAVDFGGTLAGWGTVAGVTTNAGTIDVGDTTHFLTLNFSDSLVLTDSSEIIFDLADLNNYDKVTLEDIVFGGTLTVRLANNYTPQVGDSFELFDWNSTRTQSFSSQNLPALAASLSWDTSKLEITGEIEVVPEPVVLSFIGGVAFFLVVGHRFRKRFFS